MEIPKLDKDKQTVINALAACIHESGFLASSVKNVSDYILHNSDFTQQKSAPSNFWDSSVDYLRFNQNNHLILKEYEWISTDKFHNSFFLEPYRQFTHIQNIFIQATFIGTIKFSVYQAREGQRVELIFSETFEHLEKKSINQKVAEIEQIQPNARLFWKAHALMGDAEIENISFGTDSQPTSKGRMVILLRTYGRTKDIIQLLKQFDQDCSLQYQEMAKSLFFIVLDSSENIVDKYQQEEWKNIQSFIFQSENLGGGGNMSHLFYLMQKSFDKIGDFPDELLILDDDLNITTEVLYRYFRLCCFRSQEVITSLPVFMKSRPNTIWEDGGYWGRLSPHAQDTSVNRQSIFPTLVRHGVELNDYDHLDSFAKINYCEYSTFIFFGLSFQAFQTLGYPTALFLRGDDIEYSLRAELKNIPLYTNPNLYAWHEPAHSYAQEYMATLHGILVNLVYDLDSCEFYADFFEQRLSEHSAVLDDLGLSIYLKVLETLNNLTSPVLKSNFNTHYIEVISELNKLSKNYEAISPFIIDTIRNQQENLKTKDKQTSKNGILLIPFIHFGDKRDLNFSEVLLHNPHSNKCYRINIKDLGQRKKTLQLVAKYCEQLAIFIENYPSLSSEWKKRLIHNQSENFWADVEKLNRTKTRLIHSTTIQPGRLQQALKKPIVPAIKSRVNSEQTLSKINQQPLVSTSKQTKKDIGLEDLNSLPDNFNAQHYISLHPDLQNAGVDGVKHYLLHGKKEGRKWK